MGSWPDRCDEYGFLFGVEKGLYGRGIASRDLSPFVNMRLFASLTAMAMQILICISTNA